MTRRGFLDTTFGAAATAMLPWPGAVGAAGRPMLEQLSVARLEDGLYLLSCSDWNVLALCGPQGMLLVDGGAALYTRELLAALGALPNGGPVKVLFNTHWHWNHTGSNEALAAQHAQIIAHRNTKLWLGTPITVEWQHHTYPPRPAAALPTTTFVNGTPDMQFSGQPVRYGHLPAAHTDGDLYVHLPQPNVIVAGGVVAAGRYPTIDYSTGGWIGGMA
ncbi:MAG TPA: MBL fold metallo-hydrolase, partial [Steroidobacteraceae bacterium]